MFGLFATLLESEREPGPCGTIEGVGEMKGSF